MVRQILSAIVTIVLLTSSGESAYAQSIRNFSVKNYEYLFKAHNKLANYVLKGSSITEEEYLDSLDTACAVFKRLSEDVDFKNAIIYFSKEKYNTDINKGVEDVIETFSAFLEFINFEKTHLQNNGLTDISTDQIISNIFILRARLKDFTIQSRHIFDAIAEAADATCSTAHKLRNAILERNERNVFWFHVRNWTAMLGGAVLVVVDAGLTVASGGVASPGTVLSGIVGSALVTTGAAVEFFGAPSIEP